MDACAHFFLMPLWPYLGSYIMLVNTGAAAGPRYADLSGGAYALWGEMSATVSHRRRRGSIGD